MSDKSRLNILQQDLWRCFLWLLWGWLCLGIWNQELKRDLFVLKMLRSHLYRQTNLIRRSSIVLKMQELPSWLLFKKRFVLHNLWVIPSLSNLLGEIQHFVCDPWERQALPWFLRLQSSLPIWPCLLVDPFGQLEIYFHHRFHLSYRNWCPTNTGTCPCKLYLIWLLYVLRKQCIDW